MCEFIVVLKYMHGRPIYFDFIVLTNATQYGLNIEG